MTAKCENNNGLNTKIYNLRQMDDKEKPKLKGSSKQRTFQQLGLRMRISMRM